ncbi:MAG TPA: hypothetical protein VNO21_09960, partial [Polyangiaceae bacterium]|nr:hypothetical protein [Polyangiaceae bacterium]
MDNLMAGYDMILSISQNEVNSQFERLVRSGYIQTEIASNGVTIGGILGGNKPKLTSYLRGAVSAPRVAFGEKNNAQEVEFSFTFAVQDYQSGPNQLAPLSALEAAFEAGKEATRHACPACEPEQTLYRGF